MRRVLTGVLLALLLPPLLLLGLAATESGSRWLVQAGSHQVPGLNVAVVQGNLLTGMRLGDASYRDASGLEAHLDTLSLRWRPLGLLTGQLHLRSVEASGLSLLLPPTGEGAAPEAVRLPQRIVSPLALQLDLLRLQQAVIRQDQHQWQLEQLVFSGRLDRQGLQVDGLRLEGDGVKLSASGRAAGAYPYRLAMQADWDARLPGLPEIAGRSELAGDIGRLSFDQRIDLPYGVRITGTVTPDLEAGRHLFDITGEWPELAMPVGAHTLYSRQGRFTLKGEPAAYELMLTTRLQHTAMAEPFDLELTGQGDLQHLQITGGRLLALGGEALLTGQLEWTPTLAWDVKLQASGIDPGRQWPQWPGSLALEADINGSLTSGVPRLDVALGRLHGRLRDYPVAGQGRLSLAGDSLTARDLQLRSGDNRVRLDGALYPQLNVSFNVDAANLQQVAPTLGGSLQGKGRLRGSLEEPGAQLNLRGSRLKLADLLVGELALQADVDPGHPRQSHFDLQGERLERPGLRLDTFHISGTGNAGQHQVRVRAARAEAAVDLRATGSYARQQWRGTTSELTLDSVLLGRWQLERPFEMQASSAAMHVAPFCLTQAKGRLCANAQREEDGSLHSSGELSGLPLALLKPWLSEDAEIDGVVSGSFRIDGMPSRLQAEATMQVSPGSLRYRPITGPELVADHHDGHVELRFRDDALAVQFGLGLGDVGSLQGKGSLGPEAAGQRPLQGELDFSLSDPGALGAVMPQLSDWAGPMRLHSRLGGTLQQPTVQLDGGWRDGQVRVADLGITLTGIRIDLAGDGERLNLQGQAVSGKGSVRIRGAAELDRAAGWPVRLHIEGDDFQVARRSDLEVTVAPKLDVAVTRQAISMTGQLTVPHALIVVADIPKGVVGTSPDEIVIGGAAEPAEVSRRKGPDIRAQLRLILGDDVRLKAYGLDTRLAGELELHQAPDTTAEAVGQLQLLEGRYKAYGQDLTIEQGRLLFAGPLSSAEIDVRAIRKVEQVTAGIKLTGPLSGPTAQLFSDPVMEEAQVLSYLLTGGPLSGGSQINAAALTQAAMSLGLDKTSSITGQIAGSLGLDELSVAGGENGLEASAMAIGKRLSPDLYVRYLYGLFDGASAIQLRYSMGKHLKLEGQAGEKPSVELLYEIERD